MNYIHLPRICKGLHSEITAFTGDISASYAERIYKTLLAPSTGGMQLTLKTPVWGLQRCDARRVSGLTTAAQCMPHLQ